MMPITGWSGFTLGTRLWELPPLILHPFSDASGTSKLMESSRASLMLHGLLPHEDYNDDELSRRLIEGRLCELRMLYFVGKDLFRWMGQCADFVNRLEDLEGSGIREASFAALLLKDPPENVQRKLKTWGVVDFCAIFSRAIGLNSVFRHPPDRSFLVEGFIRDYYRYADHLFACWQQLIPFTEITNSNFHFDLYASGEYSRILEQQWGES